MTKVANAIIYMLDNNVLHLNDKKLTSLLFLIENAHLENCDSKIFGETFIKEKRNPEGKILSEIFDVIANDIDLDEEDERLYLISELIEFIDIEIYERKGFIELKFIKMEEEFDEELFTKDEMKTIDKISEKFKQDTARNVANACFKIDKVRETAIGETII